MILCSATRLQASTPKPSIASFVTSTWTLFPASVASRTVTSSAWGSVVGFSVHLIVIVFRLAGLPRDELASAQRNRTSFKVSGRYPKGFSTSHGVCRRTSQPDRRRDASNRPADTAPPCHQRELQIPARTPVASEPRATRSLENLVPRCRIPLASGPIR